MVFYGPLLRMTSKSWEMKHHIHWPQRPHNPDFFERIIWWQFEEYLNDLIYKPTNQPTNQTTNQKLYSICTRKSLLLDLSIHKNHHLDKDACSNHFKVLLDNIKVMSSLTPSLEKCSLFRANGLCSPLEGELLYYLNLGHGDTHNTYNNYWLHMISVSSVRDKDRICLGI